MIENWMKEQIKIIIEHYKKKKRGMISIFMHFKKLFMPRVC